MTDACKFLESLQRYDLAALLRVCQTTIAEYETEDLWGLRDLVVGVTVRAPAPVDEALRLLPDYDRRRIAEAVASTSSLTSPSDICVERIDGQMAGGMPGLLADVMVHRAVMTSVATGGERIQEVNDYYRARDARIRAALPPGIPYNNPHADLWAWYEHWKDNLGGYADRRKYIRELFAPTIEALAVRPSISQVHREPTGWERVDRALVKARSQLETASAEEDWQAIGLLCREATISLAQAVYDPDLHGTLDGVTPSSTDANRMLEAYIAHAFPGPSFKEVRAHARASLALALNLQHRRTATKQLAALCVEATASTAAVISIIARPNG